MNPNKHNEINQIKNNFKKLDHQSINQLIEFHQRHKYLFMTFDSKILKILGRIVGNKNNLAINTVYNLYSEELNLLLDKSPTKNNRVNALFHMFGYFKNYLNQQEKVNYLALQDKYSNDEIDFDVPLMKLYELSKKYNQKYLLNQCIFDAFY